MAVAVTWEGAHTACSSRRFADLLSAPGTYPSLQACIAAAERIWWNEIGVEGWLEAFAAHPEIGDAAALEKRFSSGSQAAFGQLSQEEQAAALATTNKQVFQELAALNRAYKQKHGFIFIICASGKTAEQMLAAIKQRLPNTPYEELGAAAREQMKITQLRLEKLVMAAAAAPAAPGSSSPAERAHVRTGQLVAHLAPTAAAAPAPAAAAAISPSPAAAHGGSLRSPITTHVLDTALGRPAEGLPISLHRLMDGSVGVWDCLAAGVTDADGRIGNLLAPSDCVAPGDYQMRFNTGAYLRACRDAHPDVFKAVPFYPEAVVEFTITDVMVHQHFHIPLLLNPYGYSTYRGS